MDVNVGNFSDEEDMPGMARNHPFSSFRKYSANSS
jgi:hypothetical protein